MHGAPKRRKKKIPKILDEISPDTRLIMVNALHFSAKWTHPFDEDMTRNDMFTLQDDTEVETRFMTAWEMMAYGEDRNTLAVMLPYESKVSDIGNYAMLLLLPKKSADFAKWESEMTLKKLDALIDSMYEADVFLRMPRFKIESKMDLIKPLKQLGMTAAFNTDADFSNITNSELGLMVTQALQKIYIEVDEEGTEAAAVTLLELGDGASPLEEEEEEEIKIKEFVAKRPFLFAIVKDESTILFLGRFVKPDAE